MTAVRAEIEALESIGIDTAAGSKHETAKKIEAAKGKPGGGFKTEKQIEAEETEERADACFWDGLMNEKMDDPVFRALEWCYGEQGADPGWARFLLFF